MIDMTIENVVPKLLENGHLGGKAGIKPVLVHGDLWSGNHLVARIGGQGGMEEVIFDPSACYAHSEYVFWPGHMYHSFSKPTDLGLVK